MKAVKRSRIGAVLIANDNALKKIWLTIEGKRTYIQPLPDGAHTVLAEITQQEAGWSARLYGRHEARPDKAFPGLIEGKEWVETMYGPFWKRIL